MSAKEFRISKRRGTRLSIPATGIGATTSRRFKPWPLSGESPEKVEAFKAPLLARVVAILDRDGDGGRAERDYVRNKGQDASQYMRDGVFADLERYSRLRRADGDAIDPAWVRYLREKPADDSSPAGRWLDRRAASPRQSLKC